MAQKQTRVLEKLARNGEKRQPLFSHEEYERRIRRLRHEMEKRDVDGVLFTSVQNIAYYTNFVYTSFGRFFGVVVTKSQTILIYASLDGGHPWRVGVADKYVGYTDWLEGMQENYWYVLTQELKESNCTTVGFEADHLPVASMDIFRSKMPNARFVDISEAVMLLRMVKSEEEMEVIRQGAAVADIGGVREDEVSSASTTIMFAEVAKRYPNVDLKDIFSWCQSDINTDGAHNPVTSRVLKSGDILSINCFPMIQGYYAALERTMFVDYCSNAHLKYWEQNLKAHYHGLNLLKPGKRCCDVAKEMDDLYKEMGLYQYLTFGYGHSFGVLCHYYGREAGLELRESCETVLAPGMVLSMEPSITVPYGQPGAGTYREHDIVMLKHDGTSENVTKFPKGPEHNVVNN